MFPVQVKAENICLCLIDDCLDADVPLAELSLAGECVCRRVRMQMSECTNESVGKVLRRALLLRASALTVSEDVACLSLYLT